MLFQPMHKPNIPSSFNLHFGYFVLEFFFVKDCSKLQKVDFEKLFIVTLPIDVVLKLCQGVFKNLCIGITHYSINWYGPFVDCLVDDMIFIFKELAYHCFVKWLSDK
jgi:hypothetical protein